MPSRESKYVADKSWSFPVTIPGRWYGLTLLALMLATQGGAALSQEPAKVTLGGLLGNLLGKPAPAVPSTGAPAPDSQQDDRSFKLTQSCPILLKARLAVEFLLHRGRFHPALARRASAFPSTG